MIVLRSTHRTIVSALEAERDRLIARVNALEAQGLTLTEKLLKAHEPAPIPVLPVREADPVVDAIRAKAGSNGALRGHLARWANDQRVLGIEQSEIIAGIMDWSKANAGDVPMFFG